jgi:CRP-like cAMP-binding protein
VTCGCKGLHDKRIAGLPDRLHPRIFSGLPKAELDAIVSAATHRKFPASSVILQQEDPAERFFLLTSGRGRYFFITPSGQKVLLHWLTAGQVFGGAAILSAPSHYLASTELLSAGCALVWDKETIRGFALRSPRLLDNILSIAVTEHIAWLITANVSLSSDDAHGRIAHMLISLACGIGKVGYDGVEIQVGNDELAAGANVTPFTVSRSLSAWQREGVLKKGRGKVLLRRPELLTISRPKSA